MQKKTLREVCNMVGVTRRMIQGYEKMGLVASAGKNKYGYLLYDEENIEKIKMIRQYQDFGFSLKEIKGLLVVSEEMYLNMMNERLIKMREKLIELEANINVAEKLVQERCKR